LASLSARHFYFDRTITGWGLTRSKVTDVEIFKHRSDMTPEDYEASKVELLRNSLNVLLRRGIKGMYLHAHDPKLESYLERMNG